jgi:hypothetical protein
MRTSFIRQISNERKNTLTGGIQLLGGVVNALRSGAESHERASAKKLSGNGKSDARGAARAGDDCRLAL